MNNSQTKTAPNTAPENPAEERPDTKGVLIRTWGCQMNVYDSERMADLLTPLGYKPVEAPEDADLVILNTCHIREKRRRRCSPTLAGCAR